jgi:Iron-binding zinc finger CDGSH type
MTDILSQVESHLAIWELGQATQRAAEIDRIYTPNVEIIEPDGVIHGRAELNRRIGQLQDHFGGMSFTISGPVMTHNGYAFYQPDVPATIRAVAGGPFLVRGDLRIDTPGGPVTDTRAALCRCTRSARQPFCDAACEAPVSQLPGA